MSADQPEGPQPVTDDEPPATPREGGLPLPSPVAATNLVIADLVLRAAGGVVRDRMEKSLLKASHDGDQVDLVANRSLLASAALWGASRLARRSPIGMVVVAGTLAAKVFYDRGKQLEPGKQASRTGKPGKKP